MRARLLPCWQLLSWPIASSYPPLNSDPSLSNALRSGITANLFLKRRNYPNLKSRAQKRSHVHTCPGVAPPWKTLAAVGGEVPWMVWKSEPQRKMFEKSRRSAVQNNSRAAVWLGPASRLWHLFVARLNVKFTFACIFPGLHQASAPGRTLGVVGEETPTGPKNQCNKWLAQETTTLVYQAGGCGGGWTSTIWQQMVYSPARKNRGLQVLSMNL